MELILNELSFYPLCESSEFLEERFNSFFKAFDKAKELYKFKHVSFPNGYQLMKATREQTFYEWVVGLKNNKTKQAILTFLRKPYVDDLNQTETDSYFSSNYKIIDSNVPTQESPIGLVIASIKNLPSVSLNTHAFWNNTKILVYKVIDDSVSDEYMTAYNICLESDWNSINLNEWSNRCYAHLIDDHEKIKLYLRFTKYTVSFEQTFLEQFFELKNTDFEQFKYLLLLMKDTHEHPFSGGMGQTENLTYRGKEASKRVTQEDRLSYTLEKNHLTFIACKGHYKFH
ncbi:type II toxin-antitoxin system YoeB family toxin [Mucilaginibacter galii]|uniref:Uncharacterized protein n=1 Tax=Mucilaginibacter galii TaxID=2005073 RepID=A0A917JE38_9SPHI|nr:type II toxin-antitoxin system YoeB family toxin [Mucilaginibacter galii]GGI52421.1 hypothetical protein GCM10011425_36330 [Mucilaginibacter galii]